MMVLGEAPGSPQWLASPVFIGVWMVRSDVYHVRAAKSSFARLRSERRWSVVDIGTNHPNPSNTGDTSHRGEPTAHHSTITSAPTYPTAIHMTRYALTELERRPPGCLHTQGMSSIDMHGGRRRTRYFRVGRAPVVSQIWAALCGVYLPQYNAAHGYTYGEFPLER